MEDEEYKVKYKSELNDAVLRAKERPYALLKGYDVYLAANVQPPAKLLAAIVQTAGGNVSRYLWCLNWTITSNASRHWLSHNALDCALYLFKENHVYITFDHSEWMGHQGTSSNLLHSTRAGWGCDLVLHQNVSDVKILSVDCVIQ